MSCTAESESQVTLPQRNTPPTFTFNGSRASRDLVFPWAGFIFDFVEIIHFHWICTPQLHLTKNILHDNGVITYIINMEHLDTGLQQPSGPCARMSIHLKDICTNTNCCVLKVRIDVCMDAS